MGAFLAVWWLHPGRGSIFWALIELKGCAERNRRLGSGGLYSLTVNCANLSGLVAGCSIREIRIMQTETSFFSAALNAVYALAVLTAVAAVLFPQDASAKSGRQYLVQEYKTDRPLHGFEGQTNGGYFCSYVRIPNRKCKWNGKREVCKVKGWILRQECR